MNERTLRNTLRNEALSMMVINQFNKRKSVTEIMTRKTPDQVDKIQQMRDKLPKLNRAEIRRFRIPLHEALQAEMIEEGFQNAAVFFGQLIEYQKQYRADHFYDMIIQSRPVLSNDPACMQALCNNLKQAEATHFSGDVAGENELLLSVAYKYGFGPVDWWWLADQFFIQCLRIIAKYLDGDIQQLAMTYYVYGKYLVEQPHQVALGMQYLNNARELSVDKEWTAQRVTGRVEKYIFVEVCMVLYEALMTQARAALSRDPALALELTLEARQRGIDACLPRADVFYLLGQCERANKRPEVAVGYFMKAFLLYKTNKQMEQCCEAMIGVATAYQEMGDMFLNKEQLVKLLAFAQKENLPSYVGQAYLYMGQNFLNAGSPDSASPYLSKAWSIFHELNDVARREFVKNLGAVSKGQETFQAYVKLILRCENTADPMKCARNLQRLVNWKDSREPFWDDMSTSYSEVSFGGEEEIVDWADTRSLPPNQELSEDASEGESNNTRQS